MTAVGWILRPSIAISHQYFVFTTSPPSPISISPTSIFNCFDGVRVSMQVGRRYGEVGAVGAFLAVLGVVLDSSVLLFAAAGVGALLLTRQFVFVRAVSDVRSGLTVEQEVERETVHVDEPVVTSLQVRLEDASHLDLRVESHPPVGARWVSRDQRTVRLPAGESSASGAYTFEFASAGEYELDPPTVAVADPDGLFGERFPLGPTPTISAEPRSPRHVHVGEGGTRSVSTYGAHQSSQHGEGIDFAVLREYHAGDPVRRIDWKSTARLGEPYVQEQEVESNRETALLFDHRDALSQGASGERKVDYLRMTALAVLESAHDYDDPVGLYAVGDEGTTERARPTFKDEHYHEFRRMLQRLEPTTATDGNPRRASRRFGTRRSLDRLYGDDDVYARTLRPYVESADSYVAEFEDRPLRRTARSMLAEIGETDWSVVFTDDTAEEEVLETVNLLRRGESRVTVFLAPSVFFEPEGVADFESAYARYLEFEEFRRQLAGLRRVAAFEVAPGDRVDAILSENRRRTRVSS